MVDFYVLPGSDQIHNTGIYYMLKPIQNQRKIKSSWKLNNTIPTMTEVGIHFYYHKKLLTEKKDLFLKIMWFSYNFGLFFMYYPDLYRIRFMVSWSGSGSGQIMRIRPDPDPQYCLGGSGSTSWNHATDPVWIREAH